MATPTLTLTVDKGPKKGETLAPNRAAVIRIGRVIRGNTFTIKDPAISQKHLIIEFIPDVSKWTITDLDTSNGTIVNDEKIPPSAPFPLSDRDTIKIGETTSISVKIDGDGEVKADLEVREEEPKNKRTGRPRRAASSRVSKKDEILDAVVEDSIESKTRGVNSSRAWKKDEILDAVVEDSHGLGLRRANSSRALKKDEILDAVVEDAVELRPRRGGARTRAASAQISKNGKAAAEINVEADLARSLKEIVVLDSDIEDSIEVVPKNTRRGRGIRAPAARPRASSVKPAKDDEAIDEGKEVRKEEEENRVAVETEVDLEKTTLGEWFDSMEKYLPRAINEVADEMIASLKEKAKLFEEYIANASNAT